jgi:hypothetical protein
MANQQNRKELDNRGQVRKKLTNKFPGIPLSPPAFAQALASLAGARA